MSKNSGHIAEKIELPHCIFCPRTNISKEHFWPDWLLKHYSNVIERILVEDPTYRTEHTVTTAGDSLQSKKIKGRLSFRGHPFEGFLKVVCVKCNNEWMATLQAQSKPLLLKLFDNGSWKFTREESRMLARWLTMTAMVYDFSALENRGITATEREKFYSYKQPLSHWQYFVGYNYDWDSMGFAYRASLRALNEAPQYTPVGIHHPDQLANTTITLLCFGKIFLAAVSSASSGDLGRRFYEFTRLTKFYPPAILEAPKPIVFISSSEMKDIIPAFKRHLGAA